MSNIQSVAAAAMIGQERVTKTFHVAITGDPISDCMAGIRMVCDESKLSARQLQFMFECYAKLYKDAADQNDVHAAAIRGLSGGQIHSSPNCPPPYVTGTGTIPMTTGTNPFSHSEMLRELERMSVGVGQSGTHTPSINAPDSVAGSSAVGGG